MAGRAGTTSEGSEFYSCPMVRPPTFAQVTDIARDLGFHLEDEELKVFHTVIKGNIDGINSTEGIPEPRLPTKYPRLPGYRPVEADNPYNAWYWKSEIRGASNGKLAGKKVAIKDSVAVAGVPMMNGCHALEGFTPDFDATIVTRILDAGGTIVGKTLCENLCYSGGSSTAAKGPVKNPHDPRRSTGGSSSGSAVVVQTGEVDMAIGGDQGGSVRAPAACTGVVGLKPTYGLVPYTGAMSICTAVDHLGPMARTVQDCALFLEVLAGYDDGMDFRQDPNIVVPEYTKELEKASVAGLKVGVLTEGFSTEADPEINKLVKATLHKLTDNGAIVHDVSVPLHSKSADIYVMATIEEEHENMFRLGGSGLGHKGYHPTKFVIATGHIFSSRPDDISNKCKLFSIMAAYLQKNYKNQVYARGRNLVMTLTKAYDHALEDVDVLAMPTTPCTAMELVLKDDALLESLRKCTFTPSNTMAFNLTGHPAISVNAGFLNGLPVGLMLVGRHHDDLTVLKVAQAIEKVRDNTI